MAVIHDKKQYGEGIASSVKAALDKAGVKVVAYEGITAGDKDFSALIAKLQKENVDFVYYAAITPSWLILRQAGEKGLKAKFMGPEGVGNKDISAIGGPASEGLLVTLPNKFDLVPTNAPLVAAFKTKGQTPPARSSGLPMPRCKAWWPVSPRRVKMTRPPLLPPSRLHRSIP